MPRPTIAGQQAEIKTLTDDLAEKNKRVEEMGKQIHDRDAAINKLVEKNNQAEQKFEIREKQTIRVFGEEGVRKILLAPASL